MRHHLRNGIWMRALSEIGIPAEVVIELLSKEFQKHKLFMYFGGTAAPHYSSA